MKIKRALIGFGLITVLYLSALIWVDAQTHVFAAIPSLWTVLPLMLIASLSSWLMRFARWHWLLARAGYRTNFLQGFLAYLSGFAFTATPGKVGELVRIRYLVPMGVPPWVVLAAFVYERAFDLLAVLVLASLFISRMDVFLFVTGFVVLFLGLIAFMAMKPRIMVRLSVYLRAWRMRRLSQVLRTLGDGLSGCRRWANPLDALVAGGSGLAAWGLTSLAFVYLLVQLEVNLSILAAIAIYPLAMLAGAASMLPGGIGSVEATIVVVLSLYGFGVGVATLAAIGIRLATIWFSVVCGFIALAILELPFSKRKVS